ncbi:hypothetical protein NHH03_06175 [Stieleria sp. TO1_6]|uniref:hypothetical protein n=1 Tax=Stieleria tagensis TaxID=2956795 RepID=UPI00209A834A|nr:hypothetical protein [Stieleria tagensis]MCO8121317.1 hypothetical protein [Stieleria tagensis]
MPINTAQTARRHPGRRSPALAIALVLLVANTAAAQTRPAGTAAATSWAPDRLDSRSDFVQRLTEPHSGLVDGVSLRLAIQSVTAPAGTPQRHLNYWLDRKVNPDRAVSPGSLGPTRYASVLAIARSADCVCYPLGNCILIGRPAWVAAICQEIYGSTAPSGHRGAAAPASDDPIDVDWPMLTTPTEALEIVAGHSADPPRSEASSVASSGPAEALPHDLWPANRWHQISPRIATKLIVGQFVSLSDTSLIDRPFRRAYRFAGQSSLRESLSKIDPDAELKNNRGDVLLDGLPSSHQWYCEQLLVAADNGASDDAANVAAHAATDPLQRLESDTRTFTMNVRNQPVGAVLKGLADRAGVAFEFAPAANPALKQMVSFSAVDQTLWQLVRLILDKASLKIRATADKLHIQPRER